METEFSPIDFKVARVRAKLTQTEVAKKLGISRARLSMFEGGKRKLSVDLKTKLMKLIIEEQL